MPQETTTDMDACQRVQLAQVSWVKNKYSLAALNRLKQDNKDDPQRLQELTASFNAESEAWTELIEKASKSVQVDYAGGTIAGTAVASRQIGLLELQSHDIWEHWLRFEDSTPPLCQNQSSNLSNKSSRLLKSEASCRALFVANESSWTSYAPGGYFVGVLPVRYL